MILEPLKRWERYGFKPEYAGLPTYGSAPYTEDPADLTGFDVAIVGAPFDELVTLEPGSRWGPRAIRAAGAMHGKHLETGVDAFEVLRIVDYGDAPVIPTDPTRSHDAIQKTVQEVVESDAIPIVLGGDHSVALPDIRACAGVHGSLGLIHFDSHTDTAAGEWGTPIDHGSPMRHLVEEGAVDSSRYVQIGLRGYWPRDPEWEWQREKGITSFFSHDVRDLGIREVISRTLDIVGEGKTFISVDVDVLDPAFAPGTGTPEPGGLTSVELLQACRLAAARVDLVGADVVECAPVAIGSRDITALVADRIVREILTGLAARRSQ